MGAQELASWSLEDLQEKLHTAWERHATVCRTVQHWGSSYYQLCSADKPEIRFAALLWEGPTEGLGGDRVEVQLSGLPQLLFDSLCQEAVSVASTNYVAAWREAAELAAFAVSLVDTIAAKVAATKSDFGKPAPDTRVEAPEF